MSIGLEITSLAHGLVAEAAQGQGRAFFDDPLFVFTFSDEETRRIRLPWLMQVGRRVWRTIRGGRDNVRRNARSRRVAATGPDIALARPDGRGGFLRGVRRASELSIEMMAEVHERVVPVPHWYLMILGVDPPFQGRGVGSALRAPTLARADADRLPCYQEMAKERNVAFYERHGFAVHQEEDVPGDGPHMWMMLREAR
jgi:GNAT superfamily N-acetyltransferase